MGGNPATRALAMMHVAMSDSINTVQNRYTRYVATMPLTPGASAEAAAATAARQVLLPLFPAQKATIETAYEASMKRITDDQARKDGVAIGEKVAEAVQADRAADGTSVPDTYRPMTTPGVWVPTTPPLFAEYARAKPWVLEERRSIPARRTARIARRALRARLQRDQESWRHQKHAAHRRPDRSSEVLGQRQHNAELVHSRRGSYPKQSNCRSPIMPGCLHC